VDLGLAGRVAIVTGGSRGIGRATAAVLAREGARVAICARDEAGVGKAASEIAAETGGEVVGVRADMERPDDPPAFARLVLSRFGRIDVLVNVAGTHLRGTVDDVRDEDLDRQLHTKVFGFLHMIQAVLPVMRRQRDGRIVNVVGQASRHPHPDRLPSGITNAGVHAMTKSLADALGREGIRVNTVCPQCIDTPLVQSIVSRESRDRAIEVSRAAAGFTRATVLQRLGSPEEVANVIAFVVSDRAGFITGSSVSVDGGYQRYVG
jgi:NAD(P)-dependent dehydrogenase (short-subunit alcohol dehydrogenase family)